MKYSKTEIAKALNVIKDICDEEDCSRCPFGRGNGGCNLATGFSPCAWKVVEVEKEEVWRAFK